MGRRRPQSVFRAPHTELATRDSLRTRRSDRQGAVVQREPDHVLEPFQWSDCGQRARVSGDVRRYDVQLRRLGGGRKVSRAMTPRHTGLNPRGFAPRTPRHALSRAASTARSDRVARSHGSLASWGERHVYERASRVITVAVTIAAVGIISSQGRGNPTEWPTADGDAQHTSWIRN